MNISSGMERFSSPAPENAISSSIASMVDLPQDIKSPSMTQFEPLIAAVSIELSTPGDFPEVFKFASSYGKLAFASFRHIDLRATVCFESHSSAKALLQAHDEEKLPSENIVSVSTVSPENSDLSTPHVWANVGLNRVSPGFDLDSQLRLTEQILVGATGGAVHVEWTKTSHGTFGLVFFSTVSGVKKARENKQAFREKDATTLNQIVQGTHFSLAPTPTTTPQDPTPAPTPSPGPPGSEAPTVPAGYPVSIVELPPVATRPMRFLQPVDEKKEEPGTSSLQLGFNPASLGFPNSSTHLDWQHAGTMQSILASQGTSEPMLGSGLPSVHPQAQLNSSGGLIGLSAMSQLMHGGPSPPQAMHPIAPLPSEQSVSFTPTVIPAIGAPVHMTPTPHSLPPTPEPLSRDGNPNRIIIADLQSGKENRTTVMLRNVPPDYTQSRLLDEVNATHRGTFDFFYLPFCFRSHRPYGYAFVNFTSSEHVISFYSAFNRRRWLYTRSATDPCTLSFARIQGIRNLIERFRTSSIMAHRPEFRPLFLLEPSQR